MLGVPAVLRRARDRFSGVRSGPSTRLAAVLEPISPLTVMSSSFPTRLATGTSEHESVRTDPAGATADEIAAALSAPVLPPDPFAGRITARNTSTLERLTAWASEKRAAVEASVARLDARADERAADPASWERAALQSAVHEWRVFEAFRGLHERARCPGLLFRLRTKTDFLTLCDCPADSGPAGYGDRQRRVLSKRGIPCRRSWAAARSLVAEIGLLGDLVGGLTPQAPPSGDGVAVPADRVDLAISPDGPQADGPAGEDMDESAPDPEDPADGALPVLYLAAVWEMLPRMRKADLEAVVRQYGVGLWAQFGERFYSSLIKADMLAHAQRVVRHHAALDAAHRLEEGEVEVLYDWMRDRLGGDAARTERDPDLRIAARLFQDFLKGAALSADGRGLSPESWNRYREAELRRIGAFCYHRFHEERAAG